MLRRSEPWDVEIDTWLLELSSKFGFQMRRIGPDHWQLDIRNSQASYTMTIINQGEWITYGVVLLDDVDGEAKDIFYGILLDLSAQLNGVHVGRYDDRLVLTREEPRKGLNINSFYASIAFVNNAHQIVLAQALQQIKRLGLKLKTK